MGNENGRFQSQSPVNNSFQRPPRHMGNENGSSQSQSPVNNSFQRPPRQKPVVFVGNISENANRNQIENLLKALSIPQPERFRLKPKNENYQTQCAYLEYPKEVDMKKIVDKLNGYQFMGYALKSYIKNRNKNPNSKFKPTKIQVIVSGIPDNTSTEDIKKFIRRIGVLPPSNYKILPKSEGVNTLAASLIYSKKNEAELVKEKLNGIEIFGATLKADIVNKNKDYLPRRKEKKAISLKISSVQALLFIQSNLSSQISQQLDDVTLAYRKEKSSLELLGKNKEKVRVWIISKLQEYQEVSITTDETREQKIRGYKDQLLKDCSYLVTKSDGGLTVSLVINKKEYPNLKRYLLKLLNLAESQIREHSIEVNDVTETK
jgi:RNA recognition motif-containing protein